LPSLRTITGLRSTDARSGRSIAMRPRPTSSAASASVSTGGSPRKGLVRRWLARSRSIIARASLAVSGAAAKTTSPSASVRIPPSPSSTHGPKLGSRTTPAISSRLPRTISATSSVTGPSSGRALASSSAAAARTDAASPSPSRTRSRSLLCAIASPPSFTATGKPIASAARAAPAASGAVDSRANGTA
jgi:hypothetical protein